MPSQHGGVRNTAVRWRRGWNERSDGQQCAMLRPRVHLWLATTAWAAGYAVPSASPSQTATTRTNAQVRSACASRRGAAAAAAAACAQENHIGPSPSLRSFVRALKLSQTVAAVNLDVNRLGDDGVLQVWSAGPIVSGAAYRFAAAAARHAALTRVRIGARCKPQRA